ncbi:MAG: ATP-binding protein [Verrucomicrobiota bacterium]|nr:ATP-binding protein [Limisphaera sp.]MDW8382257.1 ATP-binding protein [Verrucomicrobiota bacterium]
MKTWLVRLSRLLEAPQVAAAQQDGRVQRLQREVILPAKLVILAAVYHYLLRAPWTDEPESSFGVVWETLREFFFVYAGLSVVSWLVFFWVRRFPPGTVQWLSFVLGFADGLFLGGLTVLTGGFDSVLYWVFPALIVLNAICIPLATPQVVLNLMLSGFFLVAGLVEPGLRSQELPVPQLPPRAQRKAIPPVRPQDIPDPYAVVARLELSQDTLSRLLWQRLSESARERLRGLARQVGQEEALRHMLAEELNRLLPLSRYVVQTEPAVEVAGEPFLLRLVILWLLTFCCYGVQVLAARQRQAEEEAKEFAARTAQLHAAGRLAAEFAHQIKNPLAIINNAAFALQRQVSQNPAAVTSLELIQEEVEKADRIITQVMGYAELSEGRVEKVDVREAVERAVARVFPPGLETGIRVRVELEDPLPVLLMQPRHLDDILTNLLQNARDVLDGGGEVVVTARWCSESMLELSVRDNGPGIPADKVERIFEPYFTMRPKGTGLGLAIVKHNTELYGGRVRVESELGKGARFTITFPIRTTIDARTERAGSAG